MQRLALGVLHLICNIQHHAHCTACKRFLEANPQNNTQISKAPKISGEHKRAHVQLFERAALRLAITKLPLLGGLGSLLKGLASCLEVVSARERRPAGSFLFSCGVH